MRNPAKRVFGVFWWGYAPTKTPHFLSSVVGNRPNAIALIQCLDNWDTMLYSLT